MFVLSTFGYHLYGITDHPHRYILFFIKVSVSRFTNNSLPSETQLRWDCCTACLEHSQWQSTNPHLPAIFCKHDCLRCYLFICHVLLFIYSFIYLYRTLEIRLPNAVEWWTLFDASLEDIQMVVRLMLQLYGRQRIDWLSDATELEVGTISRLNSLTTGLIISPEREIEMIR